MRRTTKIRIAIFLVVYGATWGFGILEGDRIVTRDLQRYVAKMQKQSEERVALFEKAKRESDSDEDKEAFSRMIRDEKDRIEFRPHAWVDWRAPLLPGICVQEDGYVVGPLWGSGQVSLSILPWFWGFRIPIFRTWIS
jgi:hypothetical protein